MGSPKRASPRRGNTSDQQIVLLEKVQAEVTEYAKLEVAKMALEVNKVQESVKTENSAGRRVFTAPDGKQFTVETEYKKYLYETFYAFKHRVGETCLRKPGDIKGQSFDLCDLKDCEVMLLDHTGQVFADDLVNCKVYIGPCGADVFVRNCTGCTFTIACKQLRMRDCSSCKMFLYSATRPALETSHHMELAPFNGAYSQQGAHFRQAGLDADRNEWDQVHDFSRSSDAVPKPHWSKLADDKWEAWEITLPGAKAKPENPVKRESDALWFTKGVGSAPVMGIKIKGGAKRKKGLFNKIGPKLK